MARDFTTPDILSRTFSSVSNEPLTIAGWFRADTTHSGVILTIYDDPALDAGFILRVNSSSQVYAQTYTDGGATTSGSATTDTYSADTWHHAAGVYVSNTSRTAYLDAVAASTDTTSITTTGTVSNAVIGDSGFGNLQFDGDICEVGLWNVVLTATEIAALAAGVSPIRIRPSALRIYVPLYGAADPEPDYRGGTWALTSAPPTSTHAPVQPAWGYDIWLPTAKVSVDTNITPPQGNLTLSSVAPDAVIAHLRSGATANLTLSPTAPTADVSHLRTPTTAQLTLSTTAPARVVASLRNPAAGDLTLSGVAPTDPMVDHARVPTTGQLVLSTTAPSLGTSVNITPPAGDLTLSATAPVDPMVDHARSGAAGDLVLSTTAPSRIRTETPDPPAGDLTLSTTAPIDPLVNHARTGTAGQLVLSTTAPTVSHPIGVSPPAGDLTLSTSAPSVGGAVERIPPQGNLTLSTTAPIDPLVDHVRTGAAGALTLSTTAPTVSHPIAVNPGAGTLTLTTTAPQVTSTQLVAIGETTWAVAFRSRTWTVPYHARTQIVPYQSRTWNVIR